MKKVLVASAALFFAAITNLSAQTNEKPVVKQEQQVVEKAVKIESQEKTPVKPEELPEAIKKAISSADYKGWTVSSAFLVKKEAEFYEVTLVKEKETKTVKFAKDGNVIL